MDLKKNEETAQEETYVGERLLASTTLAPTVTIDTRTHLEKASTLTEAALRSQCQMTQLNAKCERVPNKRRIDSASCADHHAHRVTLKLRR
jgi:hypothetical protein